MSEAYRVHWATKANWAGNIRKMIEGALAAGKSKIEVTIQEWDALMDAKVRILDLREALQKIMEETSCQGTCRMCEEALEADNKKELGPMKLPALDEIKKATEDLGPEWNKLYGRFKG